MAGGVGYSKPVRRAIGVIPVVLVAALGALSMHEHYASRLHVCALDRVSEKPPAPLIPLRDGVLHDASVAAAWVCMLALALLPARRAAALYALAYSAAWFHCTYVLLAALKAPLLDFNCAGRHTDYPNGISGHYCYFLYVAATGALLARARIAANSARPPLLIATAVVSAAGFAIGAPATLYRTAMHGYHSAQQIVLGAALGIASHATLERWLLQDLHLREPRYPRSLHIYVLAFFSAMSFGLYDLLWPTATAGPAITQGHLLFHAGIWVCVLLTAHLAGAAMRTAPAPTSAPAHTKS